MASKKQCKTQKELIIEKSSILFWEKGYSETSMRDIADSCGFRPANIYNYFRGKEEILFEMLLGEMEEILAPIRSVKHDVKGDPVEQLRAIVESFAKTALGNRRSSKLLFDTALGNLSSENRKKIIQLRDELDNITYMVIRRGVEKGVFSDIDTKLAVYSIASMISRTRIWFSHKGKYSADEVIDFLFKFVLNGLKGK